MPPSEPHPNDGTWTTKIYAVNDITHSGQPEKTDALTLMQNGKFIEGEIKRTTPLDQKYKSWVFSGYIIGETMICYYWTKKPPNREMSCGCWVQRYDHANHRYSGFYLKFDATTKGIIKVPLSTEKDREA